MERAAGDRVGKRIEPYHLFWLEDPTAHDDFAGLARIADNLVTPIAAGEYHYGIVPFRHMLEARSIDIVMIDLLRVGGITQWLKVAGMAEAFNLPVVSHLIPEIHVHLMAAIPNALTVEYMPWTHRLWTESRRSRTGQLVGAARGRAWGWSSTERWYPREGLRSVALAKARAFIHSYDIDHGRRMLAHQLVENVAGGVVAEGLAYESRSTPTSRPSSSAISRTTTRSSSPACSYRPGDAVPAG